MYMLNIYILHVLIDMILFLNKYVFDIIILLLDINHIEIITYIYVHRFCTISSDIHSNKN